ncbi:MAG: proton-conducting transporter membrane subunit, partial [Planctomycetota bacterium]
MTAVDLVKLIPWLPALAAVYCGLAAVDRRLSKAAGWVCVASIFAAFALTVGVFTDATPGVFGKDKHASADAAAIVLVADEAHADDHAHDDHAHGKAKLGPSETVSTTVTLLPWLRVAGLQADIAYFIDPLTLIMMLVITGVGGLIATYAVGYMAHDNGYARFFMAVSLFIFAMLHLVMADNLILLYLGWEGVGLCSYLLIGHYYKHKVAVDAAKKAFIVNRIGDLGFALGIFLIYAELGSVRIDE